MQKLKMSLILLLIVSTSGCEFPWLKKPIERCVINVQANYCICHDYEITEKNIGRISESKEHPLEYCHGAVVFRGDSWAALRAWFEEIKVFVEQKKKSQDKSSEVVPHESRD